MDSKRLTTMGVGVLAAGVALMMLAYAGGTARVGAQQQRCTVGVPFTPTPGPGVGSLAVADAVAAPTCTPTRVRLKTHTPTVTNTPEPTDTALPTNTPAPTDTPKPVGTSEAVSVKPPNTGAGAAGSGGTLTWMLGLGAALALLGGGSIAVGMRGRR